MKALVVFYSRTGNTRKVAGSIASELKCDIEEIIDTKNRSGIFGYMLAGMDSSLKKSSTIKELQKDTSSYDLVIIGSPVWAWNVPAPLRAYLSKEKNNLKKIAFFCTMDGNDSSGLFGEMKKLAGKEPIRMLDVRSSEVKDENYLGKVGEFVDYLSSALKK